MEEKEMRYEVFDEVISFMKKHDINYSDDIYQDDNVVKSALDFINELFLIVEPKLKK